jgi:hypothetical protein
MSIPANQLAKYRSYSYYHVLAICDTSQTASELAGETSSLDMWQHTVGDPVLGKYGIKKTQAGGEYCILINGSMDADLSITKTSWTSLTAASATLNDRNTSIALEGQISISEPRGVIFLNQVVQCCMALGVDSANAFWVLKTFFVGFTYDGAQDSDGADFISDIPPVIFVAYDVSGNFTMIGGEYEISFLAAANSAARLPQYSKSATAANVAPAGSVSNTLKALQVAVQNNYDRYYDCVYAQTKANPSTADIAPKLRKVKYIITCDPPYLDNDYYKTTDQAAQLKNFGPNCAAGAVTVPPGMSIDDAIYKIIDMSKEIKDESSIGVGGKKFTAKIQNWLRSEYSTTNSGEKVITYIVGYRLQRQEQPSSVSFEQVSAGTANLASNLITFDYMYTGKNIDILELDLKMNMGMVYLQGATIQNQYKQPGQDVAITASSISPGDIRRSNSQNIPVLFGTQIKNSNIRDTKDVATTVQHAYTMSKHSSLEALETTIKITGNPQLLGSINQTADPEFVASRAVQPSKDDGFARYSEWSTAPAFMKVNIKMPRNNNDESLFTGSQTSSDSPANSNDYAIDFWYQGYYYVYGIDHVFDNGEFYQTISALAIPEKNTFISNDSTTPTKEVIDVDKLADECYENKIGCGSISPDGSAASQTVIVYPEDNASIKTPEAIQEVLETAPTDRNLSNIEGYDENAKSPTRRALHNAAINNGVDEFTLTQFCAIESNFDPTAEYHAPGKKPNPDGAKGLFQFIGPTWRSYGGGDRFDPELNADRGAKYFAENRDALHTALGREPVGSEVYLAHNQGLGGARSILKQIARGDGDKKVTFVKPTKKLTAEQHLQLIIRSNHIPGNTANAFALWAKSKMGSTLKNGAPYDNYDKMRQSSAPRKPRLNKDSLAATKDCNDSGAGSVATNTPPPATDCGVKVPSSTTKDNTTPTAKTTITPHGPVTAPNTNILDATPMDTNFALNYALGTADRTPANQARFLTKE